MERIVYLLGAGFSAPLGLPVVANFLEKSRDQFEANRERFKYFEAVFRTIRDMSIAKNYYETDLSNIEEVLSILEMQEHLGELEETRFLRYLRDVITYHTPPVGEQHLGSQWAITLFGNRPWNIYGAFVACLLGYQFRAVRDRSRGDHNPYDANAIAEKRVTYSVVTLNYDVLLESVSGTLADRFGVSLGFDRQPAEGWKGLSGGTPLAKLHGSTDSCVMIPPTWNKGLHPEMMSAWRLAYRVLSEANHVRVLGYSLPETDIYMRFLLKAAVLNVEHLKRIDVLCLDPKGGVRQRYDSFIEFGNYRFCQDSTERYLDHLISSETWPEVIGPEILEVAHETVFRGTPTRAG